MSTAAGVALDVLAVLALLLPRPRGFGVVLGALIFGLAHDLVSLRLVSADLDPLGHAGRPQ